MGDTAAPHTLIVSGPTFRTSVYVTSDMELEIPTAPIVTTSRWEQFESLNAQPSDANAAAVMIYLSREGLPLENAQVTGPAGMFTMTYYELNDPVVWTVGGLTGPMGAAAVFNIPAVGINPTADFQLSGPAGDVNVALEDVPIVAGGTTFVFFDLPPPANLTNVFHRQKWTN